MVDVVIQSPNDAKSRVYKTGLTQAQVDAYALDFTVYTVSGGVVALTGVGPTRALAVARADSRGGDGTRDFKNYPGSPIGNITPDFIGQECQDTVTGAFYKAFSTASSLCWLALPASYLRTSPLRLVTFGDSTANTGPTQSPTSQDTSQIISSAWTAGTVSLNLNIDKYQTNFYYPQAYLVGNGGVSGETTTQMVARDTAGASSTRYAITDMINLQPHAVLLRAGGINDIVTATTATLASKVATAYANHVLILNRFMAANIPVVDCGIYGFANGSANTATDLTSTLSAIVQLNALYAAYAAQYPSKIQFINPTGLLSGSTGAYLSTRISGDGTHLTAYGQSLVAQKEAAALSYFFGPSSNVRYPGSNNISNALMANTGAVAYGTAPTGFSSLTSNATRQNAKVEVINGKPFYTCEFAITATNNNGQMFMPYDPSGTGSMAISSGDVWGFEFDFYVAGLNGYLPTPSSFSALLDTRDSVGSGRVVLNGMAVASSVGQLPGEFYGHLAFPPLKYGDASANLTTASQFLFQMSSNDSSGTYKLGVGMPRIVKLNQAVVTG